ncbi:hypothetical protein RV02_GL002333 [Enterococcus gilvus]|nr:hypothetical protein RV02_GL002333 [Enterococcus gilvus]
MQVPHLLLKSRRSNYDYRRAKSLAEAIETNDTKSKLAYRSLYTI